LTAALVLVLLAGLATLLHHQRSDHGAMALDERALDLVTASDVKPIRLEAAPGVPAETHANYRSRPGTPLAVLSLSNLPPAPAGKLYQAWLWQQGTWVSLGTAVPNADGRARIVAASPALAAPPGGLQVTLEAAPGSASPNGLLVIAWPKP
jgi:hypothetical protein